MDFVSDDRKVQLDKIFEREIFELKNNIISREEFIRCINFKRLCFDDVYYLVNEYLGPVKIVEEKTMNFDIDNFNIKNTEIISEYEGDDISFKRLSIYRSIPKIKDVKRIRKIENMALRGKNMKKNKK